MKNLQIANPKLEESVLIKLNPTERTLVQLYNTENTLFQNYNNENKQDLAKLLVRLSFFVGIKEPLSLEELKLLVFFLTTQFPRFTSEELEQAFMMACSGKFGTFEHYQSFSPIYVGKVINAYEASRASAFSKYKTLNQRKQNEEDDLEKAKKYNPLKGAYEALLVEFEKYVTPPQENINENNDYLSKFQSDVAIRVCKSASLFLDFDEKKHLSKEYLASFFVTLSKEQKIAKEQIKQYVRSNGKNMEHRQG
jgi:hypothetical protein